MSHLPRRLLDSFKAAFRETYGVDISDEGANEIGNLLLDTIGEALVVRARTLRSQARSDAEHNDGTETSRIGPQPRPP